MTTRPKDRGFDPMLFAKYASCKDPKKVLGGRLFCYSPRTITIHELHNKSLFHFIMIPRVGAPPRVPANLKDLYTLLTSPEVSKTEAEALLREMREDADDVKAQLEEEMLDLHGFKWDIWMGFKVSPSYRYLHLHIISDDLAGDGLKLPKHFFSFHPERGEFLHLDEVLSWFEIVHDRYKDNLKALRKKRLQLSRFHQMDSELEAESREKPRYTCYRRDGGIECRFEAKDFPTMKAHLKEHFAARKKAAEEQKKKRKEFEEQQARRAARLAEKKGKQRETQSGKETEPDIGEDDAMQDEQELN